MKIVIEEPAEGEEEQIVVKCREMTPEMLRILAMLKAGAALIAYDGSAIHRVKPSTVYYIESVDSRTFLYCRDSVYESHQKLYELEESLTNLEFLRISKSVIVNLSKVKAFSPALNGRFEAALENGEKVIVSRQYMSDLKKKLGI